jgi:MHS family proline/betaine transporter-like MFS transporter
MTISLIEEFLLLALEDSGGEFANIPETSLSCGIAGAALMDLAIRNKIDSDLASLWAVDPSPTDSDMLNRILGEIAAEPQRLDAKTWIARLTPQAMKLRDEALAKLCERGILRRVDNVFLWVLKARRYPVEKEAERLEGKRRILALLFNQEIPDPYDVALVALANACSIFERILTPSTLIEAGPRIRQLSRMDLIGAEIAHTAQVMNAEIKIAERRTAIAGLAGNVMEWYDFGIYGFFAAVIGRQFFPAHDPAISLLASFGVFAVGFIGRPVGALLFGHVGDRYGRKTALMLSVILMAVPTLAMGLMPTYAQIGTAAPILLVAMRLFQGLAVGGEFTTSIVLMVEEAQRSRRGIVGSFAPFGAIGGLLLGSVVGGTLAASLSAEATADWGWRAAFLTGLIIGGVVLFVRRRLPPDQTITAIEDSRRSPIVLAFKTQWRTILKIVGTVLVQGTGFYLCFVYLASWIVQYAHVPSSTALLLNGLGLALLVAMLPVAGAISDRIGRKPLMLLSVLGIAVTSWPLFLLVGQGSIAAIIVGQACMAVFQAGISGALPAFMVEALPKHVRCTALSVGQNLAQACFGGTVPLIAVYLISTTGYSLAPAIYLTATAVVSFIVILATEPASEEAEPAAG